MKALALVAATFAACILTAGTSRAQSPTPSPSPVASASPSPAASPSVTASASPSPTATRTPTPAPTATPIPTATPPVTNVPPFPSSPQYLRAFPGPEPDSWYIYASGFTPRVAWTLEEVLCPSLPCSDVRAVTHDLVKEDGTMSFYAQLGPATDPSHERMLAVGQTPSPAGPPPAFPVPAGAPSIRVAGRNPGVGLGYPAGTRTGIAAVDGVIALMEAHDIAAIRARVVLKSGTTASGEPVRGVASWQCAPYFQPEGNLDQVFEVPGAPVYAVFRVPNDPALPLRYTGATYGIAGYGGGVGSPLGGLILLNDSGQVVGTEIWCGTPPGFHVHNFTDFILPPYTGPTPASPTPGAPGTGMGTADAGSAIEARNWFLVTAVLVAATSAASFGATRRRTKAAPRR